MTAHLVPFALQLASGLGDLACSPECKPLESGVLRGGGCASNNGLGVRLFSVCDGQQFGQTASCLGYIAGQHCLYFLIVRESIQQKPDCR